MQTAFCVISILYVFIFINLTSSKENRDIPWFINRNSIYYIDTKPIYTSQEAQEICIEKYMMFTVSEIHIPDILDYIESVYGHIPSFWTYDNHQYANLLEDKKLPHERQSESAENSCYKLSTRDLHFRKENCNEKMSLICKRNYMGASLYFVNGTHRDIGRHEVADYCNPHSHDYQYELELCLIRYFKIPRELMTK